jgi:hypothetical protein
MLVVTFDMTKTEIDLITRALDLLHRLAPYHEPVATDSSPLQCPVVDFIKRYLCRDASGAITSQECWEFYREVADTGELPKLTKMLFLRRLTTAMEEAYNLRKSHDIQQGSGRVRGFRGLGIRDEAIAPTWSGIETFG